MSSLTDEQRKRIEENRQKAIALRQTKHGNSPSAFLTSTKPSSGNTFPPAVRPTFPQVPRRMEPLNHNTRPGTSNAAVGGSNSANAYKASHLTSGTAKIDVTLSLLSKDRVQVVMPYNYDIIQQMKTVPSRYYDPVNKRWDFSLQDYVLLVKLLKPFCEKDINLHEFPPFVKSAFAGEISGKQVESTIPDNDLSTIDAALVNALFPFQRDGINFGISRHGRVLFADEMGLGKTIQALGVAAYYRHEWPVLIISPSSVRYNWMEAVRRWLPCVAPENIFIINTGKDTFPNSSLKDFVVITTYDVMTSKVSSLKSAHFNVVIMDESHHIKNYKTARYKAAAPLLKCAKRVMLLTGTPALSRPAELYCQIDAIRSKLFANFKEFGNRYCEPKENRWGIDYSGASNMEELKLILEKTLMIRRMKNEVLSQLPNKTRDMIVLDKSSVKSNLQSLQRAAAQLERSDLKGSDKHGALLKFFAETAHAKLDAVRSYMSDLFETGRKLIVFAHHRVMIDELCTLCSRLNIGFVKIDGTTPPEARKQAVDRFQADESIKAAVLSIKAANAGITLTASSLVVFAELFWNPGILVQAEDRAHRVGQIDNVQVQYLVAKGTADDKLWPLIQKKLGILTNIGLGRDDFKDASTTVVKDSAKDAVFGTTSTSTDEQTSLMSWLETLADSQGLSAPGDTARLDDLADDFDEDDFEPMPKKSRIIEAYS